MRLGGKKVIVTGANSSIEKAIALLFDKGRISHGFCTSLKTCMNNLGGFFKDEVKSLLSWNFQVFQVY